MKAHIMLNDPNSATRPTRRLNCNKTAALRCASAPPPSHPPAMSSADSFNLFRVFRVFRGSQSVVPGFAAPHYATGVVCDSYNGERRPKTQDTTRNVMMNTKPPRTEAGKGSEYPSHMTSTLTRTAPPIPAMPPANAPRRRSHCDDLRQCGHT